MSTSADSIARSEAAEKQTRALLELALILKPLSECHRRRVMRAIAALLDAEREVQRAGYVSARIKG